MRWILYPLYYLIIQIPCRYIYFMKSRCIVDSDSLYEDPFGIDYQRGGLCPNLTLLIFRISQDEDSTKSPTIYPTIVFSKMAGCNEMPSPFFPASLLVAGVRQWKESEFCPLRFKNNSARNVYKPLSKFRMVCQTLTWLVTDELLLARPDHEQIIKGIGDINADLPASSTIHFTTSPFPSMSQTNSYHYRAIPLSLTASLSSGYSGTQET